MVYRRLQQSASGTDWHCNSQCPFWPQADYIDTNDLLSVQQICAECIKLESAKRDMSSCYYLERVARQKHVHLSAEREIIDK